MFDDGVMLSVVRGIHAGVGRDAFIQPLPGGVSYPAGDEDRMRLCDRGGKQKNVTVILLCLMNNFFMRRHPVKCFSHGGMRASFGLRLKAGWVILKSFCMGVGISCQGKRWQFKSVSSKGCMSKFHDRIILLGEVN